MNNIDVSNPYYTKSVDDCIKGTCSQCVYWNGKQYADGRRICTYRCANVICRSDDRCKAFNEVKK